MVLEKTIRTKRVNRYTSMRRNENTFIFPSTVGLNGKILEPKNGMNYPLAELINGSKAQSGGNKNTFLAIKLSQRVRARKKNFRFAVEEFIWCVG